ncbi:sensor domain-containing diguanylate cyclase [Streptomyces profundus]|uniref:sensor domain-containing diguanylate cyclase n=1 Tax=Streptomyces profundus TaxID=2867410 RepID=UPI001D16D172|nr:sensor domain-containing diguanylate cyclase [Streptomyces sp. MA3_2.13]UED88443.1 diguanylate cyclase [Streptomyces sp. MA3_2.13]
MNALHYLNTARSLADTLQTVADRAVADLGYELAVVNVVRQDGDLVVTAVSGSDAAESQIAGKAGPRAAWDHRLTMGDAWGNLRFVSQTEWETLEVDGVPEYLSPARVEGEWHPQDRLYAPMYSTDGALLGVLSVHGTQTGRMPGRGQRQTLQTYAYQAAIAISNARLRSNMQRALARLEREQQAVRASKESFRQAFEYAPSGAAIAEMSGDEAGRPIRTNDALCRLLGRPASVMRRYALSDLLHLEDVPTWMRASSEGGPVELRLSRRDGTYVWVSLRNSIVADTAEGPRFWLTHVEDIQERKLRELELTHHATHDQLTGLANSMGLHARLSDRLCGEPDSADSPSSHRHATSPEDPHTRGVAIVFCALRGFKSINANFGHEVGDAILVEIGRCLHTWTHDTDTVARLGGDEFVLLVDSIDPAGVRDLVASTANELRNPLHLDCGQITRVNWSFGITWARCGATVADTIRAAREAAV